jgi:hypothetical protein
MVEGTHFHRGRRKLQMFIVPSAVARSCAIASGRSLRYRIDKLLDRGMMVLRKDAEHPCRICDGSVYDPDS